MQIREILQNKGSQVYTIAPNATIREAARRMVEYRCGSLVVSEDDKLVGIFTERDLLRVAAAGHNLDDVLVRDHMTTDVVTGSPNDPVKDVMGVLTEQRIRHLPILDEGKLVGLISIGDVVKCQYHSLQFENHVLKSYIQT